MRRSSILLAAIVLIALVCVLFREIKDVDVERVATAPHGSGNSTAPELHDSPRLTSNDETRQATRDAVPVGVATLATEASRARKLTIHVFDPVTSKPWPNVNVELVELRLSDTAPKPPPGAAPIYLEFGPRDRKTDESGNATFDEVAVGRFSTQCNGLDAYSDKLEFDATNAALQTIELQAWRSAKLKGLVLDDTGAPVGDAWIGATPQRSGSRRTGGISGREDGTFEIPWVDVHEDGVRGIKTLVRASSRSFLDVASVEIDLRAGDNELPAPLVFHSRAATLRGRIVDALGDPLRNENVECQTLLSKSAGPFSTRSDDQGRFVFEQLAPGRFTLGCASICLTATSPIEVAAGAKIDVGDLKPPPERFEITGTAVFEDGNPAIGATVSLGGGYVTLGGDGAFTFSRCSTAPVSLTFRWHEADENLYWHHDVRNVVPGSAPLRVVLIPRGPVFRLVDSKTRALVAGLAAEAFAYDKSGQGASYRYPATRGELRLDLDDMSPPVALRFVVAGYRAHEMKYEPPKGGYPDRHVIEIPLEKL